MSTNTIRHLLFNSTATLKTKPALTFLRDGKIETELSYAELGHDAERMSNVLRSMGIGKSDRVILFLQKSLVFIITHLALQKIGAITVPLNPEFKRSEMEYLIQDNQPKAILVDDSTEPLIQEIDSTLTILPIDTRKPYQEIDIFNNIPDNDTETTVGPEDPALIIYTSGTTGKPKGVVLTQKNLSNDAGAVIDIWDINQADVICHALPLFHAHGFCFALQTALIAGAHVLLMDRFVPDNVIEALSQQGGPNQCSVFMAVPAMYGRLMACIGDRNIDFGHLRLLTSGSAPLLPKDFKRIQQTFGKEPVEREGMSETGMNFSNPLRGEKKPGSIGSPLPSLEARIVDPETGLDVSPGQTGEIWLRGPSIFSGYWKKDKETADTFEQGWFKTGDLGNVDADGYYYLTDRIKDIIISGGENISPKEIEAVINSLDEVLECSVLGIQDEKWGEKVVAAVVRKPETEIGEDKIKETCIKHLHKWKCPKQFIFLDKIPRNLMGKALKDEVRSSFQ
ncbi:MAG: class I adenylate-forming enzyme family protein [Desulfobacterales bacterium]|nr:class I adenylate-forming enzyme family protein [Desulfobacterales bacterium]MDX2513548.1 class I adenylate-forming enzyme family protein [Desulfobacterales bacterium]